MSLSHIALGVIAGTGAIVVSLFVGSYFSVQPQFVLLVCLVVIATTFSIRIEKKSRLALQLYWDRKCTGFLWKRSFPASSADSIRQFLDIFVIAFMFPNRQLKFSPDDQVLEVYRALYPECSLPDALELEMLARLLAQKYGTDIAAIWRDDITLGELYAQAVAPKPGSQASSPDAAQRNPG